MKRRLLLILPVLLVLFLAFRFGEGYVKGWYADHYIVRPTSNPATPSPDHVCLTWNGNPRTTIAIQWRTAPSVSDNWVEYRVKAQADGAGTRVKATSSTIEDDMVKNDPAIRRFAATLTELHPGTQYAYRVGNDTAWSPWTDFTTAPDKPEPFSFIFVGDVQRGFDHWGNLLHEALRRDPQAAFCVIPGDLADNGAYRDQWDAFFNGGEGVFDRLVLVPALGNHDYARQREPRKYLDLFTLPEDGPKDFPPEHDYSFMYGNARVVVLDSNLNAAKQTPWLEDQLRKDATWKFVVFHHPVYSSAPHRDNEQVRDDWAPLFDKYGVDIAIQGHDHAYLRTYPMRDGRRAEKGTIYVIAVGGTKYYKQPTHDYAQVAFPNVSTYQIIDVSANRLTYRAYDPQNQLRDQFTLEK